MIFLDPLHTDHVVLNLTRLSDEHVEVARNLHGVGKGETHDTGVQRVAAKEAQSAVRNTGVVENGAEEVDAYSKWFRRERPEL